MNKSAILKKVNTKPHCVNRVAITQAEFDSVLMNPNLTVVEKTFHGKFETMQVLFVIDGNDIDWIAVKEITESGTTIFKEV